MSILGTLQTRGGIDALTDATVHPDGGIAIATNGTDADSTIVTPHLTSKQTAWATTIWGTDNSVIWEADITIGASIDHSVVWAGLKLTFTHVSVTDDDQVFFRYENGVNSGKWQCVSDVNGGALIEADSGVTVAINTTYKLRIVFTAAGVANMYIDGVLVETAATFAGNHTDLLIPYIGALEDGESAVKTFIIRGQSISRAFA